MKREKKSKTRILIKILWKLFISTRPHVTAGSQSATLAIVHFPRRTIASRPLQDLPIEVSAVDGGLLDMSMPVECLLFVYFSTFIRPKFVFTLLFFTFRNIWANVDVVLCWPLVAKAEIFGGRWWRVCCHAVLVEANRVCVRQSQCSWAK